MQKTENYGLNKPDSTDKYNVEDFNENMEILDAKIAECFQSVSNGKQLIASAITDKGVTTSEDATFAAMASNIGNIKTSGDMQEKTATLSTSKQTITPDAGYDGLSKVTIPAITGTAGAGDVLAGKTFNSATAGIAKTGTLADKTGTAEYTVTPALDSTNKELKMPIPATGKYNTNNKLKATFATIASLIGLTSAKLASGNTILGISGNSNVVDTSAGTATAAQILKDKIAYVDGAKVTGTMTNRQGTTVDATAVSQDDTYTYFTTPAGSYSASSKVRTKNSNLVNLKAQHWATYQELTTYDFMALIDNVYLVYTPGLPVTFTGATILSSANPTTNGGQKPYLYLVKATAETVTMTISHAQYTIFVSPPLGKKLSSCSWTMKTGSASSFSINVEQNAIYSYFVNCKATFTNAEIISYVHDNDGYAYLIKATSTTMTVKNDSGAAYGGSISSKIL